MDFYSVASSRPFTHGQTSWKRITTYTSYDERKTCDSLGNQIHTSGTCHAETKMYENKRKEIMTPGASLQNSVGLFNQKISQISCTDTEFYP